MKFRRVRTGARYRFQPVMLDAVRPALALGADLKPGDVVRVVKLHGAPPPNTMGHCHIENLEGKFLGMVCTNSLQPLKAKG